MKCNVGGMDRTARLVVGVILVLAGLLAPVTMPWRILLFIIAAIALVTATVRYCPANAVLGINTFEGKDGK
jgi:disulfide bond formation protein DsbB